MTTYANLARHTGAKHYGPVDWGKNIVLSFIWALEFKRKYDRASAAGPLDHDTIKRIAVEVDAAEAARRALRR